MIEKLMLALGLYYEIRFYYPGKRRYRQVVGFGRLNDYYIFYDSQSGEFIYDGSNGGEVCEFGAPVSNLPTYHLLFLANEMDLAKTFWPEKAKELQALALKILEDRKGEAA